MTTLRLTDYRSPRPAAGTRPLHVVMVDEELPYPPTSGKRLRTFNLTMRLAARHRITYICHRNRDPDEARRAAEVFVENGVTPVVVDRAIPPHSGVSFYARLARNLFSSLPYSVVTHCSRELVQALVEHANTQPVDLWHCEWAPYAEALRPVRGPKLVVAHNVESIIWRRYFETETNLLKRWFIGRQWRKFERFECRVLGEATRAIAVSEVDAARLRHDFGVPQVDVVENGVDIAYFRPSSAPRDPAGILFLGSLDWRPNLDGVTELLDRVFPAVRAIEPGAMLRLVGRNPPDWLRRRAASVAGVELLGNVPDVRPYLADCGMMVVPLRIGGGSRLKILEALASGVPVVSTRIGAEGLCLEPGRHLTVVNEIDGLAPAILAGIRHPEKLTRQAESGRREVLRHHDWDALAEKQERVWHACTAGGRTSRTAA
jgi:glycosyltransferase involved in cell wall biosynthesis